MAKKTEQIKFPKKKKNRIDFIVKIISIIIVLIMLGSIIFSLYTGYQAL